ncbi:NACHT domain-containing protein [Catellatospora coxensis]
MTAARVVSMRPVVSWPHEVRPGQSYLITVDLDTDLVEDWPYELEEYSVACLAEGTAWCRVESRGSNTLVVHRFGGTYGPIEFVAHVGQPEFSTAEPIRLTFLTGGGLPFRDIELWMSVTAGAAEAATRSRVLRPSPGPADETGTRPQPPSSGVRLSPEAEELATRIREFSLPYLSHIQLPQAETRRVLPVDELYVEPFLLAGSGRTTLDELLGRASRIVILGDPGSGKSTVLSQFAWATAKNTRQVPFLVRLRDFGNRELTLIELLQRTLENMLISAPEVLLEAMLEAGRAVLLFDGLDELIDAGARRHMVGVIEGAARDFPETTVVVTARPIGYPVTPLDDGVFTVAQLAPFTETEISDYVRKWFRIGDTLPLTGETGWRTGSWPRP